MSRRRRRLGAGDGFLEFFFAAGVNEPHSTRQIEDAIRWGLETTPDVLFATRGAPAVSPDAAAAMAKAVRCPVLVLHGAEDEISPHTRGEALADATRGPAARRASSRFHANAGFGAGRRRPC